MSVNGQPTIKYLTTWYRSLFKTRKSECAKTLLWPDPHSLGLVSAWSEFRNRLSRCRRVQSCLGYVERRRRYSYSEAHVRLPVMTCRYPRMTMANSCRRYTPFNKPLLMPSTSNVWSGIGGCRCYTPGYKHNHIDMSSSRVGKIHFAKVQSKQQLQQQQQEIESHLKPLAKQKRKLPKIRPIMRPRIVPKPKKAPILTLNYRDDIDTLEGPQKRMEYMESTARTMGKHNYLVKNWQLNHAYSLPKLTWKPPRRTVTTLTSVPVIIYKHPEFNLPIRLPPMPKKNLKQIQKKPETVETVKTVRTVKTGKTVKTKAKKANKATKAKKAKKAEKAEKAKKAKKSNEKETTVLKSDELDGIKLLLGDLLNGKAPSLKQRKRDIEYGKTSPTFKMMAHSAESRNSLHNKQFVKQLENPIFFTHPLMRTQNLMPVQSRRTVSMAPKLTQHLEQRRNEQLNMRLNALLAASQYDEDVD